MSAPAETLRPPTDRWNLTALFSGVDDPKIDSAWSDLMSRAEAFDKAYRGQINCSSLTARTLLSAIMDGDVCRLCKREVFDLGAMSDAGRAAFLKACAGEVCVTYRMPIRTALAAAAFAAAAVAVPTAAAACSDPTEVKTEVVFVGGN